MRFAMLSPPVLAEIDCGHSWINSGQDQVAFHLVKVGRQQTPHTAAV